MKSLVYVGTFRHRKLYAELLVVVPVGLSLSGTVTIYLPPNDTPVDGVIVGVPDDVSEQAVTAVIAAHDPTTPNAAEAAEIQAAANDRTLRDRADQSVTTLEQAWGNWSNLTNAQKDAALKLNVRVTAAMARIVLRKLDAT